MFRPHRINYARRETYRNNRTKEVFIHQRRGKRRGFFRGKNRFGVGGEQPLNGGGYGLENHGLFQNDGRVYRRRNDYRRKLRREELRFAAV